MNPLDEKSIAELLNRGFAERMAAKLEGSWVFQHRSEQRRRMGFVLRMAAELKNIRDSKVIFCGMWAELAIEAVITGNLEELKSWGIDGLSEEEFTKNTGDAVAGRRYAEAYSKFREICEDALITAVPREKV